MNIGLVILVVFVVGVVVWNIVLNWMYKQARRELFKDIPKDLHLEIGQILSNGDDVRDFTSTSIWVASGSSIYRIEVSKCADTFNNPPNGARSLELRALLECKYWLRQAKAKDLEHRLNTVVSAVKEYTDLGDDIKL